jgi:outer membrane protein assembly factor BamB
VAAEDQFELLSENDLDERCLTTPAIVDGEIFLRTERHLYCFREQPGAADNAVTEKRPADATRAGSAAGTSDDRTGTDSPSGSEPSATAAARSASETSWPLARGDRQATGVARTELPEEPELLWTFAVDDGAFETAAVIAEGRVYLGGLDGPLYAIDLTSGEKDWAFPTELGFLGSASYGDGKVYAGDVEGRFYCLDAADGKEQWRFEVEAEINSSANFWNDKVIFGSQDANLYCLDAASGELAWKFQSEDQIRCFPSIVDDRALIAGCDGRLHVIDLNSGQELKAVDIQAPTGSAPAILGDTAYVGTEGNTFFAIDWQEGKIRWQYENPERAFPFRSSAAVSDRAVVVGSRDKLVHALDPKSGEALWTFATGGRVDGSPVIVGDRVFVGSADGRLFALDLESGETVWQFEAGGSILASPAVADSRLVIGTDDGAVYCFGAPKK